jgi:hypothetical protein
MATGRIRDGEWMRWICDGDGDGVHVYGLPRLSLRAPDCGLCPACAAAAAVVALTQAETRLRWSWQCSTAMSTGDGRRAGGWPLFGIDVVVEESRPVDKGRRLMSQPASTECWAKIRRAFGSERAVFWRRLLRGEIERGQTDCMWERTGAGMQRAMSEW